MNDINIFCFGFGQVAKNFIRKLITKKFNIILTTTSRSESSKKFFNGINYDNYLFNSDIFDKNLLSKLKEADHILVSIPPEKQKDLVIKNFSRFIENSKAKWITYLSATSVYGDHKGEWVDEKSEANPTSKKGIARLKAENAWVSLEKNFKLPIQIFRLSGIYSNEKNSLIRLRSGDIKLIDKKNHYFSRIHAFSSSHTLLFRFLNNYRETTYFTLTHIVLLLELTFYTYHAHVVRKQVQSKSPSGLALGSWEPLRQNGNLGCLGFGGSAPPPASASASSTSSSIASCSYEPQHQLQLGRTGPAGGAGGMLACTQPPTHLLTSNSPAG